MSGGCGWACNTSQSKKGTTTEISNPNTILPEQLNQFYAPLRDLQKEQPLPVQRGQSYEDLLDSRKPAEATEITITDNDIRTGNLNKAEELDSFKDNLGEYCKELQQAGKEYDPNECFILNVSIAVGDILADGPSPRNQAPTEQQISTKTERKAERPGKSVLSIYSES
ncbi:unnamed protein product [Pleuronectes platessa]|uniref:Apical junction molecule ajm1 alpha/beta domain-containing protein n=1 Tax=Pleuronectes platessa TaxID=8262 RepID=A0A9N7ZDJ1_PLEPL|nr:unnamed protein product [Pleuronectes platessa]